MMSAARYKSNEKKAIFIFCLFVVLILQSIISEAQVRKVKSLHAGIDASFGVKTFTLNSNISKINRMNVVEEGGSAGVMFLNTTVKENMLTITCEDMLKILSRWSSPMPMPLCSSAEEKKAMARSWSLTSHKKPFRN